MKKTNLENLYIKAIKKFKKEHKGYSISRISALESYGDKDKYYSVLFGIYYFNEDSSENLYVEISSSANE